jgi:two-component system phosphate regulon response regulator OmpR
MNALRQRVAASAQAPHILVVDDDRRLRELLARFLSENGFRVTVAKDTIEARARRELFIFDGVVLDVMMPGENGFDFARVLRAESDIPIMMLTARVDTVDRVEGLEIGADDYLPKPFEPRELLLRLNNMLRRTAAATAKAVEPADTVSFGDFIFRIERGELRQGNELVRLTDRERELLQILARKYGETVPREEIAGDEELGERTVDVQINRLRRKIEADPSNPVHLQTVRGAGYRLLVD